MKKAGALRSGFNVLLFHDSKKSGDDFVLQPPLCGSSVQIDNCTDICPFAAPYQASYSNLCIIGRETRKADCIAQFRLAYTLKLRVFVISPCAALCSEEQGFIFAGLIRPPVWSQLLP